MRDFAGLRGGCTRFLEGVGWFVVSWGGYRVFKAWILRLVGNVEAKSD